ncbi:hypothetical protein BDY19DRAFT_536251 [Irpex rosettiformis]|uniref:Uncharacterized protein n=1 Tax=Irpex rosettiformis TaxID=378272 RepID=A0ACB8TQX8_9APHY|nr:hypothetical protein BDY19DRAFT_536251 [Irpex rosettiformis]
MAPSKSTAIATLALISALAIYLVFLIPPSSADLVPEALSAYDNGAYPDGLYLRKHYTGIPILDRIFSAYGGFFALVVDGRDQAMWLFCVWFLPQLCGVLIFCYWEADRAQKGALASRPTVVCIAAQALTAGVTIPLFFISHLLTVPLAPNTPLPPNPVSKARALLPAITLGYLLPSVALIFPLPSFDLNTVQLISAIWQPFPLYISAALFILQCFGNGTNTPNEGYFQPLKRAYIVFAVLSAVSHVSVLTYMFTSISAPSFAEVFLPPYWFPDLHSEHVDGNALPAYRVAARTLLQHDWFTMTLAAFVFFFFSLRALKIQRGVLGWTWKILTGVVFGPGAAMCFAAVEREEAIWAARTKRHE